MQVAFVKMEGAGNDYIYVDAFDGGFPLERAEQAARRWSDRHFGIGSDVRNARVVPAAKPGLMLCRLVSARTSNPVVTTKARDAALCATPSPRRNCSCRAPAEPRKLKPPAVVRIAGMTPKAPRVSAVTVTAKRSTRQSIAGVDEIGSDVGINRTSSGSDVAARNVPAMPPTAASSRLSVTN